ncbi:hypothetical protein GCM10011571_30760 [Marinithermofilum abyssi]|uniref:Uncharacterized protein n=1 Tax=Marinithermofilum abyssi TaxID=1571185 RepID=A0A8J2VK73_9BACL|nr:hypothetical protein GCM10011571_30760 [Marinithermofilum abyssi]
MTSQKIKAHSVTSKHLEDESVTSDKLAQLSVRSDHLLNNVIHSRHIARNQIHSDHLAAESVQSEHIEYGAVTSDKIADGSIGAEKLSFSIPRSDTRSGFASFYLSQGEKEAFIFVHLDAPIADAKYVVVAMTDQWNCATSLQERREDGFVIGLRRHSGDKEAISGTLFWIATENPELPVSTAQESTDSVAASDFPAEEPVTFIAGCDRDTTEETSSEDTHTEEELLHYATLSGAKEADWDSDDTPEETSKTVNFSEQDADPDSDDTPEEISETVNFSEQDTDPDSDDTPEEISETVNFSEQDADPDSDDTPEEISETVNFSEQDADPDSDDTSEEINETVNFSEEAADLFEAAETDGVENVIDFKFLTLSNDDSLSDDPENTDWGDDAMNNDDSEG